MYTQAPFPGPERAAVAWMLGANGGCYLRSMWGSRGAEAGCQRSVYGSVKLGLGRGHKTQDTDEDDLGTEPLARGVTAAQRPGANGRVFGSAEVWEGDSRLKTADEDDLGPWMENDEL
ncbi:hypothetical protein H2248_002649 [Termitomyces sp. 'cryptogamus']|nr:hypothetical protein H2248_002649 [Termitomyces sp. 'cryptogamus']